MLETKNNTGGGVACEGELGKSTKNKKHCTNVCFFIVPLFQHSVGFVSCLCCLVTLKTSITSMLQFGFKSRGEDRELY